MLLPNQLIKIKINTKTLKKYLDLGYDAKVGQTIMIPPEDLCKQSKARVLAICDSCGAKLGNQDGVQWANYQKTHDEVYGDLCCHCKFIKTRETNLKKYGVSCSLHNDNIHNQVMETWLEKYGGYPLHNMAVKEKIKSTNLNRYGVESVCSIDYIREKQKKTLYENYGVENPTQSLIIKNKIKETNRIRYGADSPMQNQEVLQKTQKTNLEKYGVATALLLPENVAKAHSPDALQKAAQTMSQNGTVATSKPQLILSDLLKTMYGDCLINVPCSSFLLDCVINVNDSKIDIEYDGSYWHQDIRKDLIRDKIVQKNGYKVLRIKSKNKIPNQEQIQKAIQFLLQPESYFTQIILDDYKK